MNAAVKILDFETAAILRDEIDALKKKVERATTQRATK
jgi:protein-arginine kinase activator protein McsA